MLLVFLVEAYLEKPRATGKAMARVPFHLTDDTLSLTSISNCPILLSS
jgi:hypothetical protein